MAEHYDDLKKLLREMFALDQADLDFGVYRVMRVKHQEIETFLDARLPPKVREILSAFRRDDRERVEGELRELTQRFAGAGIALEEIPAWREKKRELDDLPDATALEGEVYGALITFFRRYYSEGDFISLRRYKAGVYAIPYEGEEVKLHWANADQYYVKTTERFQDYRFKVADGRHVHFRLVRASTERENNQAVQEEKRRFVLREEQFAEEREGDLSLYFEYRVVKKKQEALNAGAVERILGAGDLGAWHAGLGALCPTQSNASRTVLSKHLADYTVRNTFDYFIHKDLGGFLRRELDFYLKNEVLYLDDLTADTERRVVQQLSKARAIKEVGQTIITFLAQLEDFQKRLYEKKKFVVRAEYCVTVDRVREGLYPAILANGEQRAEWERLFAISDAPGAEAPDAAWLRANPHLIVDTRFFDGAFKDALLANVDDIDAAVDGVLVQGDNAHALNLLRARYAGEVAAIYIDPPYNTGKGDFLYKDNFQHSSWLSAMNDRLGRGYEFLDSSGVLLVSIDDHENYNLRALLNEVCGAENFILELIWDKTRKNDAKLFSVGHEYMSIYARSLATLREAKTVWREEKPGAREIMEKYRELRASIGDDNKAIEAALQEWYRTLRRGHPAKNLSRYKHIDKYSLRYGPWRDRDISWNGGDGPRYDVVHPETGQPCKVPDRGWGFATIEKMNEQIRLGLVEFRDDHTEPPIRKAHLIPVPDELDPDVDEIEESDEDTDLAGVQVMPSFIQVQAQTAVKNLRNIMGRKAFTNPKDEAVIARLVSYCTGEDALVLDYFAGSGTTGQAVINLNTTQHGSRRKYVLVEMGEHFDTVMKPRIQRVIYSKDWANGKPVSREGSSHCFKYLTLESYEDTLNNLAVPATSDLFGLLAGETDAAQETFMLSYLLTLDTAGSASLLDVERLVSPEGYTLRITQGGETETAAVDLVETFNYLLGLRVRRMRVAEGIRLVEGTAPDGVRVLVVWRDVAAHDDAALWRVFSQEGYAGRPAETALDRVYVNGDTTLQRHRGDGERWEVLLTEEHFQKLMFETGVA